MLYFKQVSSDLKNTVYHFFTMFTKMTQKFENPFTSSIFLAQLTLLFNLP